MPIYTRSGDRGETGLFGGRRVPKQDLRITAYGTVDELNALLGLLRSETLPAELDGRLQAIQETLFELGADLATEGSEASLAQLQTGIEQMEAWIDGYEAELTPLRCFILPGGHREAALLHVLRTACRRAERAVWSLLTRDPGPEMLGGYLNRLSDLLFVLARHANHRHGVKDVPWRRATGHDG